MRFIPLLSMLLAAFWLQDRAATAQTLTTLTDGSTGIQLGLPPELLHSRRAAKWGTNWQYAGNTLNVDTLNFGNRSLADLNATLRSIRGRRISNASMTQSHLLLEGRDSNGTWFYVMIQRQAGLSRGLSIVYSNASYSSMVRSIAASFVPFPDFQAPQPGPSIAAPSPPAGGDSERVSELARELERVKEQLKQQELERERQLAIEVIRKQERERLEREYAEREKERLATLSEEKERVLRAAKVIADERSAAEQRRAQKLGADGEGLEVTCGNREGIQASTPGC